MPEVLVTADLDNPRELVTRRLRPSDVISRDFARTQAWALTIYNSNTVAGVRWWSYHDARWASAGFWDLNAITDYGVGRLDITHPAIAEAAEVLSIRIARS